MLTIDELTSRHPHQGRIDAIVLRSARNAAAALADEAQLEPGRGLIGDHRARRQPRPGASGRREITLFQAEHLPLLALWAKSEALDVTTLRRNLVVSGLNLLSMRSPRREGTVHWRIGDAAVIEITGPCDPCSKMEQAIGEGAYNAMRGHGGVTARIIQGGMIRVGDLISVVR